MNGWVLFALLLVVGLGMLISGVIYLRKEKDDPDSVNIYRVIAVIGAALSAAAFLVKFAL